MNVLRSCSLASSSQSVSRWLLNSKSEAQTRFYKSPPTFAPIHCTSRVSSVYFYSVWSCFDQSILTVKFFGFSTCILSMRTERGSVGNVWLLRRRPRGQRARERPEGTEWVLYCEGGLVRSSACLCFLIHSLSGGQRGRGWQGTQTEVKRKMKQRNVKERHQWHVRVKRSGKEPEKKRRWFKPPGWLSINKITHKNDFTS